MKNILIIFLISISFASHSQTINWGDNGAASTHLFYLQSGLEYGLTFGAGYGYRLPSKLPVLFNLEYSFPAGNNLVDDFKSRIGGQIDVLHAGNFHFAARMYGVFRHYHSEFVRINNFGCDMSGALGYYRRHWFVAGEAGFDKAIVSEFRHGQAYRDIYPGAVDGWYEPATGGNFYYGLNTGASLGKNGITVKIGRVLTQDFKTAPLLPFYAQIGYGRWF